MRVRTCGLVRLLIEQLLRGLLWGAPVLPDQRADVEEQTGPGVEQRVEAGVVLPDRLVALGMRQNRPKPRPSEVEEAALETRWKDLRRELDEHAALPWSRLREVGVREPLAPDEALEHDFVEKMLAGEVHCGQVRLADHVGAHRLEGRLEGGAVVLEHAGAHVRRGHDRVESRALQAAEHGEASLHAPRTIVDARDPMAMEVDEAAHDLLFDTRARASRKGWYGHPPMASVNPHTRELVFKLVFYGPGLGGKTTTLQYIYAATKAEHRGKMVSLATPTDRTLYFDFLPIRVPRVRGMAVRLQLFTVPGQVYYAATRKLVLSGADGVVFVADSQKGRTDTNQEALNDLHANLAEHNRTLDEVPHTFHWNKRDLSDLVSIEDLERRFNKLRAPSLGTVATKGESVFEGLERITRLVLNRYEDDPKVRIEASADPRSSDVMEAAGMTALPEEDIAQALREMEGRVGGESPTKISAVVPEAANAANAREVHGARGPIAEGNIAPSSERPSRTEMCERPDSTRERAMFSMCDLWPESERESVRHAEAMMAAKDAVNAILACDVLVTRVLASAAGLVSTLDAPRDPAVVALLLGLDGSRYLLFRTAVRAARHREKVTMKDAFEGFTFALEARRARELLRR